MSASAGNHMMMMMIMIRIVIMMMMMMVMMNVCNIAGQNEDHDYFYGHFINDVMSAVSRQTNRLLDQEHGVNLNPQLCISCLKEELDLERESSQNIESLAPANNVPHIFNFIVLPGVSLHEKSCCVPLIVATHTSDLDTDLSCCVNGYQQDHNNLSNFSDYACLDRERTEIFKTKRRKQKRVNYYQKNFHSKSVDFYPERRPVASKSPHKTTSWHAGSIPSPNYPTRRGTRPRPRNNKILYRRSSSSCCIGILQHLTPVSGGCRCKESALCETGDQALHKQFVDSCLYSNTGIAKSDLEICDFIKSNHQSGTALLKCTDVENLKYLFVTYNMEEPVTPSDSQSIKSVLEGSQSGIEYDPLYDCAFQFARSRGYGFVEFVEEKAETHQRKRSGLRSKLNISLPGRDDRNNPVRTVLSAYGKLKGPHGKCKDKPRVQFMGAAYDKCRHKSADHENRQSRYAENDLEKGKAQSPTLKTSCPDLMKEHSTLRNRHRIHSNTSSGTAKPGIESPEEAYDTTQSSSMNDLKDSANNKCQKGKRKNLNNYTSVSTRSKSTGVGDVLSTSKTNTEVDKTTIYRNKSPVLKSLNNKVSELLQCKPKYSKNNLYSRESSEQALDTNTSKKNASDSDEKLCTIFSEARDEEESFCSESNTVLPQMGQKTSLQYKLCNSISATIFRETQLAHKTFVDTDRLSVGNVDLVHFSYKHALCDGNDCPVSRQYPSKQMSNRRSKVKSSQYMTEDTYPRVGNICGRRQAHDISCDVIRSYKSKNNKAESWPSLTIHNTSGLYCNNNLENDIGKSTTRNKVADDIGDTSIKSECVCYKYAETSPFGLSDGTETNISVASLKLCNDCCCKKVVKSSATLQGREPCKIHQIFVEDCENCITLDTASSLSCTSKSSEESLQDKRKDKMLESIPFNESSSTTVVDQRRRSDNNNQNDVDCHDKSDYLVECSYTNTDTSHDKSPECHDANNNAVLHVQQLSDNHNLRNYMCNNLRNYMCNNLDYISDQTTQQVCLSLQKQVSRTKYLVSSNIHSTPHILCDPNIDNRPECPHMLLTITKSYNQNYNINPENIMRGSLKSKKKKINKLKQITVIHGKPQQRQNVYPEVLVSCFRNKQNRTRHRRFQTKIYQFSGSILQQVCYQELNMLNTCQECQNWHQIYLNRCYLINEFYNNRFSCQSLADAANDLSKSSIGQVNSELAKPTAKNSQENSHFINKINFPLLPIIDEINLPLLPIVDEITLPLLPIVDEINLPLLPIVDEITLPLLPIVDEINLPSLSMNMNVTVRINLGEDIVVEELVRQCPSLICMIPRMLSVIYSSGLICYGDMTVQRNKCLQSSKFENIREDNSETSLTISGEIGKCVSEILPSYCKSSNKNANINNSANNNKEHLLNATHGNESDVSRVGAPVDDEEASRSGTHIDLFLSCCHNFESSDEFCVNSEYLVHHAYPMDAENCKPPLVEDKKFRNVFSKRMNVSNVDFTSSVTSSKVGEALEGDVLPMEMGRSETAVGVPQQQDATSNPYSCSAACVKTKNSTKSSRSKTQNFLKAGRISKSRFQKHIRPRKNQSQSSIHQANDEHKSSIHQANDEHRSFRFVEHSTQRITNMKSKRRNTRTQSSTISSNDTLISNDIQEVDTGTALFRQQEFPEDLLLVTSCCKLSYINPYVNTDQNKHSDVCYNEVSESLSMMFPTAQFNELTLQKSEVYSYPFPHQDLDIQFCNCQSHPVNLVRWSRIPKHIKGRKQRIIRPKSVRKGRKNKVLSREIKSVLCTNNNNVRKSYKKILANRKKRVKRSQKEGEKRHKTRRHQVQETTYFITPKGRKLLTKQNKEMATYVIGPEGHKSLYKLLRRRYSALQNQIYNAERNNCRPSLCCSCHLVDNIVDNFRHLITKFPETRLRTLHRILSTNIKERCLHTKVNRQATKRYLNYSNAKSNTYSHERRRNLYRQEPGAFYQSLNSTHNMYDSNSASINSVESCRCCPVCKDNNLKTVDSLIIARDRMSKKRVGKSTNMSKNACFVETSNLLGSVLMNKVDGRNSSFLNNNSFRRSGKIIPDLKVRQNHLDNPLETWGFENEISHRTYLWPAKLKAETVSSIPRSESIEKDSKWNENLYSGVLNEDVCEKNHEYDSSKSTGTSNPLNYDASWIDMHQSLSEQINAAQVTSEATIGYINKNQTSDGNFGRVLGSANSDSASLKNNLMTGFRADSSKFFKEDNIPSQPNSLEIENMEIMKEMKKRNAKINVMQNLVSEFFTNFAGADNVLKTSAKNQEAIKDNTNLITDNNIWQAKNSNNNDIFLENFDTINCDSKKVNTSYTQNYNNATHLCSDITEPLKPCNQNQITVKRYRKLTDQYSYRNEINNKEINRTANHLSCTQTKDNSLKDSSIHNSISGSQRWQYQVPYLKVNSSGISTKWLCFAPSLLSHPPSGGSRSSCGSSKTAEDDAAGLAFSVVSMTISSEDQQRIGRTSDNAEKQEDFSDKDSENCSVNDAVHKICLPRTQVSSYFDPQLSSHVVTLSSPSSSSSSLQECNNNNINKKESPFTGLRSSKIQTHQIKETVFEAGKRSTKRSHYKTNATKCVVSQTKQLQLDTNNSSHSVDNVRHRACVKQQMNNVYADDKFNNSQTLITSKRRLLDVNVASRKRCMEDPIDGLVIWPKVAKLSSSMSLSHVSSQQQNNAAVRMSRMERSRRRMHRHRNTNS